MIYHRKTAIKLFLNALFSVLLISGFTVNAQQDINAGKALFSSNCASCHNPLKDGTGPALHGVTERVPDRAKLHAWIKNNQQVLQSGNVYFNTLFREYNKTPMDLFPQLSESDIHSILDYLKESSN